MSEPKCPVCGGFVEPCQVSGRDYCPCCHMLVTQHETYADRLAAELASAKSEIGFIKQICDGYAEFGRPMDPEANLPELAERVYGTVCDLVMELDKAKAEIEELRAKYDSVRKYLGMKGADDGRDY